MQDFRKLLIWQKGIGLVKYIYEKSGKLPEQEKYGLVSQLNRAAVSISSNIAEGASRKSKKDFRSFLEFSLGSAYELETQLIIIKELGMLDEHDCNSAIEKTREVQKMPHAFIEKL